jgi:hypothetical protein
MIRRLFSLTDGAQKHPIPNVAALLADSANVIGRGDRALPMKPNTCGHATKEEKTTTRLSRRIFDKDIANLVIRVVMRTLWSRLTRRRGGGLVK